MSATEASAIYRGWIRHRRHYPHPHAFRYRSAMLYVDLAELQNLFDRYWLWSLNHRNLAEFRRSDYLGDPGLSIDEAVRGRAEQISGHRPQGPIRLLTQPRYYGYCFNPVSFYYCFEADGEQLSCIVAEITNTPWKERHSYVLPVERATQRGETLAWQFDKAFHVSPFMPMDRRYQWRFQPPGEQLRVHMNVLSGERSDFDATLVLDRRPLNGAGLARCLIGFPGACARVVTAIHWQAFLIWCKRNPVYDHPDNKSTS